MLRKFRLAGNGACVGAALALPAAVWDSWQRHLGAPELKQVPDGTYRLAHTNLPSEPRAWIFIFDINAASRETLVLEAIRVRLGSWWPELGPAKAKRLKWIPARKAGVTKRSGFHLISVPEKRDARAASQPDSRERRSRNRQAAHFFDTYAAHEEYQYIAVWREGGSELAAKGRQPSRQRG